MARVGDEIVVVIQQARPISATAMASTTALKVRRGDVRRAVVVRTKKEDRRPDGRYIRFDDNAAVLINNKKELLATRINGVVSADLRLRGWGKIASIAPKVRIPHFPIFPCACFPGGVSVLTLNFYRWSNFVLFHLIIFLSPLYRLCIRNQHASSRCARVFNQPMPQVHFTLRVSLACPSALAAQKSD